MAKQYRIIKATYDKLVGVIFECVILNNMNAPKWFQDFEVRNNARLEKIEIRLDNIEKRLDNVETRLDSLENKVGALDTKLATVVKLNNLKTE